MKVDGDNLVPLGKSHSAFTMIGVKSEAELQCIHIFVLWASSNYSMPLVRNSNMINQNELAKIDSWE